jgi:hypothetical protein
MSAPKNNQFWKLRSKHGRDKLFASSELLWEAACQYFKWCDKHPWYKIEQIKGPIRPVKDKNGEWQFPSPIVEIPTQRPYTLTGLCLFLKCSSGYFRVFKSNLKDEDKDFLTVINAIEETIYTQKFEGAAVGAFNANIIARDLGLTDKTDITTGGEKIPQTIIKWGDKEIKV